MILIEIELFGKLHDLLQSRKKRVVDTSVSSRIVTNLQEHLEILLERWLADLQDTGSIGHVEHIWLWFATHKMLKSSLQILDTKDCCRRIIHRGRERTERNVSKLPNPKSGILKKIALTLDIDAIKDGFSTCHVSRLRRPNFCNNRFFCHKVSGADG